MSRVIVDQNNRALLNQYKWFIKSNGYVTTKIKGKFILLHRLVMKAKEGEEIAHINKNKLDNRRSNLRFSDKVKNLKFDLRLSSLFLFIWSISSPSLAFITNRCNKINFPFIFAVTYPLDLINHLY